jgi:hypothetical protein
VGKGIDRQTQQEMTHGRIAGKGNRSDGVCRCPGLCQQLRDNPCQFAIDNPLQLQEIFLRPAGIFQPGNHIESVLPLRIQSPAGGSDAAVGQIDQSGRNGCRAEIYGDAVLSQ